MNKKIPTIHLILAHSEQVFEITTDLTAINRAFAERGAKKKNLCIYPNTSPLVALQLLDGEAPWRKVTDNEAWMRMASAVTEAYKRLSAYEGNQGASTYKPTPLDLPVEAAIARSKLLEANPRIADMPTQKELSEIILAAKFGRPIKTSMFRAAPAKGLTA